MRSSAASVTRGSTPRVESSVASPTASIARAFGVFSAFIVALFTEMYGVPLTIYLLTSWLGTSFLGLDLTHNGGHLWAGLTGWQGDPHLSPFHLASYAFIIGGFWLMAAAWHRLYAAQR